MKAFGNRQRATRKGCFFFALILVGANDSAILRNIILLHLCPLRELTGGRRVYIL